MNLYIKTFSLALFFTFAYSQGQAQQFGVLCDTAGCKSPFRPHLALADNLFDDGCHGISIDMKNKENSFTGSISLQRPIFITLFSTQLLAIPNKSVTGTLKRYGDEFIIPDTNNINRFIQDINDTIRGIIIQYSETTSFNRFLILFDSLERYVNNIIIRIASPLARKRYNIDIETVAAINQYYKMRLAHFSVLPILLTHKNSNDLYKLLDNKFTNINSSYWLQVQSGRIFLRTYFTNILLPQNNYDLQKSLAASSIFKNKDLRNYAKYNYFKSALGNDSTVNNLVVLKKEFAQYESENHFNEKEKVDIADLKRDIGRLGNNVIPLFSQQILINQMGRTINTAEKNALLRNKGNIIIDYWASWCAPCIEFIKTLHSDEIMYKGEKYKLIFISVDEEQQKWLSKSYPAIGKNNSFRLTNSKAPSFYSAFKITRIPRLFLIQNGILINENFQKEKL